MEWRFWRWKQHDLDLEDEIAHDLAAEAAQRVQFGMSRGTAEAASRRDFGNVSLLKENLREQWITASLQRLAQDVRYGWRNMRANPMFTALAVLSLALGIGANTSIYSVTDAILFRALPVPNPGELTVLNWRAKTEAPVVHSHSGSNYNTPAGNESPDFPWPAYQLFRTHTGLFSSLFAFKQAGRLNVVLHGEAEQASVESVSGSFFSGLGVVPAAGRLLTEADDKPGAPAAVVISFDYWQQHFAANPDAIGQSITINSLPFTIAGVAARSFFGVSPGSSPLLYVPISLRSVIAQAYGDERSTMFIDANSYWVDIMGRLRPGVTLAGAQAELSGPFHHLVLASAANNAERADLPALWLAPGGSGQDSLRRSFAKPLLILMTMVALILAIACANIANLLLARADARRREIAVRLSLGAGRFRVVRQLLTESLMLAMPGGLLGLAIAAIGIRFLVWLLWGPEAITIHAAIDWRILSFTIAIAFATGILFGLVPALQATRLNLTPALKEARASARRKRGHFVGLGQLLVVFQVALSLLLVLSAALFVRTLNNLRSVNLGFNPEHILTFSLDASQAGFKDAAVKTLYNRLDERFRALPGVRAATIASMPLVANWTSSVGLTLPGIPRKNGHSSFGTSLVQVGPMYFETMQLPILMGRPLGAADIEGAPLAAVVNQVFAKKYFPNRNPIGLHFGLNSDDTGITIVGVAKDARYNSLKTATPPVAYLSFFQTTLKGPPGQIIFELRTTTDPLALAESVRQIVHTIAPQVPVTDMLTQTQIIDSTIAPERTFAALCTTFAILALAIACVGLYGTVAYSVSRRTSEIGIRMALGAARRRILSMVISEVLVLAFAGVAIGLLAAWSSASTLTAFLFGVKPADPLTFLLAPGILLSALLIAAYAPAHRASRIDPLTALRHE